MGIIKAIAGAVGGGLADQWLEVFEPNDMGSHTVFTNGVPVRQNDSRNSNLKGTNKTISNGSVIHVYDNQFMMLIDGGKIVDYTAEPGYYTVNNSSLPSLFNGQFGDTLKESFSRIKFSGITSTKQEVFFINLQEVKGIKFGTRNPVTYLDPRLGAYCYVRAHGSYSIKITDPIKFYREAIPRNKAKVEIDEINEQYFDEFLSALQSSINLLSTEEVPVNLLPSKSMELSKLMRDTLDEEWNEMRGLEIQNVGIADISLDDETKALLKEYSSAKIYTDPSIAQAHILKSYGNAMEKASGNSAGSMTGFLGMGMAMQQGGGVLNSMMAANSQAAQNQQMQQPAPKMAPVPQPAQPDCGNAPDSGWTCECGKVNKGKFCSDCGKPKPEPKPVKSDNSWTCECGKINKGKFCSECGKPQPNVKIVCDKCGFEPDCTNGVPKFCPNCGDIINNADKQ